MIESNQIMIDLETWGRQPDGAIASIGATCFNLKEGIIDKFYKRIDLTDSIKAGGTIHPETMKWWMVQNNDARQELVAPGEKLKSTLIAFIKWYNKHDVTRVWARNVIFDISILNTALENLELKAPYSYRDVRDVYGLEDFIWPEQIVQKIEVVQADVRHHGLHDAIYQTEELLIKLRYLNIVFQVLEAYKTRNDEENLQEPYTSKRPTRGW